MHGQTDSMATDKQERRAAIVAQLAAAGWTPIQGRTAIANKTYPTAVGPKEAQVYWPSSAPRILTTCCRASTTAKGAMSWPATQC